MTEINTNAQANRLTGLVSGLNTKQMIEGMLQIERRRLQPIEGRKNEAQVELDSYENIKEQFTAWNETVQLLASNSIWEGKIVVSSNEDVATATATAGASPGKHTLVVDRLALNHQISSQAYESADTPIGPGRFLVKVGEANPVTIVIDETNNSLEGLKDAINSSDAEIGATIIRTGNQEKPHQLVLTSQKTGSEGRIILDIGLEGGETPNFSNRFDAPSEWKGVGEITGVAPVVTGTGASNAIIRVIGEYIGEDDKEFTFTAIQTGTVGGENALQMRWKASTGESGVLELDSFNYAPGEPIEFADGLSLIISEGDIIVSDSFTVRARAGKSDLFWWLPESDRAAAFTQPSRWQRQATFGGPVVEGPYTGDEDREFTLTVEGGGQIGVSPTLVVIWESDDGETGRVRVGRGYTPGTKLALLEGLTLSLNAGVLNQSDTVTFRVTAASLSSRWWLDDAERNIPSEILDISQWESVVPEDEEEKFIPLPEFPEDFGPRISSTEVTVNGEFVGDEPKIYTFTALRDGTIGTTKDMRIRWNDDKGGSGEVTVGDTYQINSPIPFDSGLTIAFGPGRVFKDDSFTLRTTTATIQPPQDALIRLGATEFGGGLEITSPTNELEDVIEGVKLRLVASGEKPVTITIKGDTDRAIETVLDFANQYNEFATLVNELTNYNPDTNEAGPLLGDSAVDNFRNTLSSLLINPVTGLPREGNMIFTLGLRIDENGLLTIDEDTLRNKIQDDFGAVADLFRSKGESENSGIAVVGLTNDTQINPSGYPVEITQVPTRGSFTTSELQVPIVVTEQNKSFFLTVGGRQSESIEVPPGTYTMGEYVRALQNEITNDAEIGSRRLRVTSDGNQVRILAGNFGSQSSVFVVQPGLEQQIAPGFAGGLQIDGTDVAGTINAEPAEGLGQILRGSEESLQVKGLRLFVTLNENQLAPNAPETFIKVTKGVASRIGSYLSRVVDPLGGDLKRITDGLRSQIRSYDTQLEAMNERIERKRTVLQKRFTRLETQLSSLRSQQRFIASQGGGGGGGGIPGLPGFSG